jgi:hypothetical protein
MQFVLSLDLSKDREDITKQIIGLQLLGCLAASFGVEICEKYVLNEFLKAADD